MATQGTLVIWGSASRPLLMCVGGSARPHVHSKCKNVILDETLQLNSHLDVSAGSLCNFQSLWQLLYTMEQDDNAISHTTTGNYTYSLWLLSTMCN